MASSPSEIAYDASPMFVIYKDGRVERLVGEDFAPPSLDPQTNVDSKDIVISPETGVSVRIYKPKSASTSTPQPQKLPLLLYVHGGGFCIESAFSPTYHKHLNYLVAEANVVAVSVDYRRAPEHPLPIARDDSWAAVKWVAAHSGGNGQDEWLNSFADFNRLFLGGDSAGGNIAHHMAMRVGSEGLAGAKLRGMFLVHPYFWGKKLIGDEEKLDPKARSYIEKLWFVACPKLIGLDDPTVNPDCDPNLGAMGCERVLVCVAEKDALKDRGWFYGDCLKKTGWRGSVDVLETKGEGHVFHLFNPDSEKAAEFIKQLAAFINKDD